jgi:acyl transferase domain-containing protein
MPAAKRIHRAGAPPSPSAAEIRARCVETIDTAEFYEALRQQGLEYGPSFRRIEQISRRDGEAIGRLQISSEVLHDASAYYMHPALLDAGLQLFAAAVPRAYTERDASVTYLPVRLKSVRRYATLTGAELWAHVVLKTGPKSNPEAFEGDLILMDADGQGPHGSPGLADRASGARRDLLSRIR